MKKLIFLLILVVILTTGCTLKNINTLTTDDLVDTVMRNKSKATNSALKGYKFYLPNGMQMIDDSNNNNVIYSNGDKYYLYVDLVSYYNKKTNEYKINTEKEAFFSKILNYNDKSGYILVTKYQNKYFVEVMYNYSKIEVITRSYKEAITKSLIVLKSIEFNDKIIETLIGTNILEYDEEDFNLLGPSSETIDFLQEYEDVNNEFDFDEEQNIEISD